MDDQDMYHARVDGFPAVAAPDHDSLLLEAVGLMVFTASSVKLYDNSDNHYATLSLSFV